MSSPWLQDLVRSPACAWDSPLLKAGRRFSKSQSSQSVALRLWRRKAKSDVELIAPVMDARRGQIYAALYRRDVSRLVSESEDHVCTAAEFLAEVGAQAGNRSVQFVSPAPEIIQGVLNAAAHDLGPAISRNVERVSPLLAPVVGELAFERANRGEVTDALRLDANYIRRSDAELSWKVP